MLRWSGMTRRNHLVQAVDIQRKAGGETRPEYAFCLNNLAALYNAMGRYEKSESLLRQTLEIWRKAVGERHSAYATGLVNLAVLYRSMGRFEEAEPLFRQGVDIEKEALGEQHPEYAAALQSLASLYCCGPVSTGRAAMPSIPRDLAEGSR